MSTTVKCIRLQVVAYFVAVNESDDATPIQPVEFNAKLSEGLQGVLEQIQTTRAKIEQELNQGARES